MKPTYEFETAELRSGEEGFVLAFPGGEATIKEPLSVTLKAVPDILSSQEWETYSVIRLDTTIVFFLRKQTTRILVPRGFG